MLSWITQKKQQQGGHDLVVSVITNLERGIRSHGDITDGLISRAGLLTGLLPSWMQLVNSVMVSLVCWKMFQS